MQSKKSQDHEKLFVNINNFNIISKIDSGSFGSVYSVQNTITNKEYAAKILNSSNSDDLFSQMINREINIMLRFHHPTIISFLGYSLKDFNNEDKVTLIMKLAKNGSLAHIIQLSKEGLLNSSQYDNTTRQIILVGIARGMMYLHKHRVIHRDLKPGNILIDEFFHPLITDFGLSKFYELGHSKSQSQHCGTTIYMAPEVISGKPYNGKADVYSFGILMFEVVTEEIPYPLLEEGKMSLFEFNNKVVGHNYRPQFNDHINPNIKELIEKCWSNDPDERPSFEELFKKLAFEEDKYYLDGVNADELGFYTDYIMDDFVQDEEEVHFINASIEKVSRELDKIAAETKEMKKQQDKNLQSLEKMKNKTKCVKRDNEQLKAQMANFDKQNEYLVKRYERFDKKLES